MMARRFFSTGTVLALLVLVALVALEGCGRGEPSEEVMQAAESRASWEDGGPRANADVIDDVLLTRAREPFFGDLSEIRERRFLRVLVSYSKTNFFYDRGIARGFEVDMLQGLEKSLNSGMSHRERTRVVFIPTPFDRLLPRLAAGEGEMAAAGLTVTPEREAMAAFSEPYLRDVEEVIVAHRGAESPKSLEDLSGRRIVVRAWSSYADHLRELNATLVDSGQVGIKVIEIDPRLATEDLLEMVHSGVIDLTVADTHIAAAWAEVLPGIVVREDLAIHSGGSIAWAVRKESPELLAGVNGFIRRNKKGSLLGNMLFKRYYAGSEWIGNPNEENARAELERLISLFQKYGEKYGFEWQALAAQAFQESGLDQSRRSRSGAIGIMQLLPTTAADKAVAIADIHKLENNIHAGAKYMAFLRDRYFSDEAIEPSIRVDFAWAAYNVGPARVRRLRERAAQRGLDPDRWFSHVEQIAAEEIGREPVDYVANINKYYVAYTLQYQAYEQRQVAREAF